jgi:hypothetical protein
MPKQALLPLFLQFAVADFACAAANSPDIHREFVM